MLFCHYSAIHRMKILSQERRLNKQWSNTKIHTHVWRHSYFLHLWKVAMFFVLLLLNFIACIASYFTGGRKRTLAGDL